MDMKEPFEFFSATIARRMQPYRRTGAWFMGNRHSIAIDMAFVLVYFRCCFANEANFAPPWHRC